MDSLEIAEIEIARMRFERLGAAPSAHWDGGQDRLVIETIVHTRFRSDPDISRPHETRITVALASSEADALPLPRLEQLGAASSAILLEAIAVELRKMAADFPHR
jgi:hypothetical protein